MAEAPLPRESGTAVPPAADTPFASDAQLVAAILRNDRKATAQLVSQHTDAIHGYVRHRLAPRTDLVEDVVQDVFLAALESLRQFRGTSTLRAWLLGIARHKVEDVYRRQLRIADPLEAEEHEPAIDAPLAEDVIDRERARARAHSALQQLPERYAYMLLWRYWENRSVRDIAEATGKTEKAIERTLARARARFRQLWERKTP